MQRYAFTDSLRKFVGTVIAAADRGRVAKIVVCARDTLSVLRQTGAVIAVCILFPRVTKYILYRFKVTGSLRLASNLQYPPSHPSEALYYPFCVRLPLDMFCFEPDTALIQM